MSRSPFAFPGAFELGKIRAKNRLRSSKISFGPKSKSWVETLGWFFLLVLNVPLQLVFTPMVRNLVFTPMVCNLVHFGFKNQLVVST